MKTLKTTKTEAAKTTASALSQLMDLGANLPGNLAAYSRGALARARVALGMAEPAEGTKKPTIDATLRETASALAQVLKMAEQSTDRRTWGAVRYGRLAMAQARAALKMRRPQQPVTA